MGQFDWKVMRIKVASYPDGTTAQQIYDDITTANITSPIDVEGKAIRGTLYARGSWDAVVKKANAAAAGQDTSDVAIACQNLVVACNANDTFAMTAAPIAAKLTADINSLETAGILSADDVAAVLALAVKAEKWCDLNGWSGVALDQVIYGMSDNVQKDPALQ